MRHRYEPWKRLIGSCRRNYKGWTGKHIELNNDKGSMKNKNGRTHNIRDGIAWRLALNRPDPTLCEQKGRNDMMMIFE